VPCHADFSVCLFVCLFQYTDRAIKAVKAIDRERDVLEFTTRTGLLNKYHRVIFDVLPPKRGTVLFVALSVVDLFILLDWCGAQNIL